MCPASVAAIAMPRARMVFADQAPNQRCVLEGTLLQAGSSNPVYDRCAKLLLALFRCDLLATVTAYAAAAGDW